MKIRILTLGVCVPIASATRLTGRPVQAFSDRRRAAHAIT